MRCHSKSVAKLMGKQASFGPGAYAHIEHSHTAVLPVIVANTVLLRERSSLTIQVVSTIISHQDVSLVSDPRIHVLHSFLESECPGQNSIFIESSVLISVPSVNVGGAHTGIYCSRMRAT